MYELVRTDERGRTHTLKLHVSPEQGGFVVKTEYKREWVNKDGKPGSLGYRGEVLELRRDEQGQVLPAKYVEEHYRDGRLTSKAEREYQSATIGQDLDDALFDLDTQLNPKDFPIVFDMQLGMRVKDKTKDSAVIDALGNIAQESLDSGPVQAEAAQVKAVEATAPAAPAQVPVAENVQQEGDWPYWWRLSAGLLVCALVAIGIAVKLRKMHRRSHAHEGGS